MTKGIAIGLHDNPYPSPAQIWNSLKSDENISLVRLRNGFKLVGFLPGAVLRGEGEGAIAPPQEDRKVMPKARQAPKNIQHGCAS